MAPFDFLIPGMEQEQLPPLPGLVAMEPGPPPMQQEVASQHNLMEQRVASLPLLVKQGVASFPPPMNQGVASLPPQLDQGVSSRDQDSVMVSWAEEDMQHQVSFPSTFQLLSTQHTTKQYNP